MYEVQSLRELTTFYDLKLEFCWPTLFKKELKQQMHRRNTTSLHPHIWPQTFIPCCSPSLSLSLSLSLSTFISCPLSTASKKDTKCQQKWYQREFKCITVMVQMSSQKKTDIRDVDEVACSALYWLLCWWCLQICALRPLSSKELWFFFLVDNLPCLIQVSADRGISVFFPPGIRRLHKMLKRTKAAGRVWW